MLKIDFSTEKPEQPLDLMYLENGLSWSPTYLIELVDDKTANLTLRAEVVNNAENINNWMVDTSAVDLTPTNLRR